MKIFQTNVFFENVLVEVRLMATGDAPIMKQKNYKVDQEKKVEWIIAFIRKYLKLEDAESLVRFFFLLKIETAYNSKVYHLSQTKRTILFQVKSVSPSIGSVRSEMALISVLTILVVIIYPGARFP